MNKEFVPYEIALAMKELGFDNVNCLGVYYGNGEHNIDYEDGFILNSISTQYYAQKAFQNGILAPLYQQAFRWFLETHGLKSCDGLDTFEETQDACLRKLIEIVKEN